MSKFGRWTLLLVCGFALLPPQTYAGNGRSIQVRVTGIYTNMNMNKHTGDMAGVEVFLVQTQKGYHVIFQAAEGEPSVPVIAPAIVSGAAIEFIVPPGAFYQGKFSGRITSKAMIGHFDGGQLNHDGKREFVLQKMKSYWQ
jgi:hypothetical protein